LTPINLKDEDLLIELSKNKDGLFLVASYGKIIPKNIVELPEHGTLNIHPSLLPKYRGASPLQTQILNDEKEIGTTIMLMDEKMDHGPIVAQKNIEINDKDWPPLLPVLEEKLFREGGKLLIKTLEDYIKGKITPKPQDEIKATYCEKIKKEDGLVDLLNDSPKEIYTKYCALYGWPQIYFIKNGKRIKITEVTFTDGELIIKKVLPEGKKEIKYEDFLRIS
jgi:methionyl-tRNA formyltransferase